MESLEYKSEVAPIQKLLLKHPRNAFVSQKNIEDQWRELNYTALPDYDKALKEYDAFVSILEETVSYILFLPPNEHTGLDSLYVRDASIATPKGVILCNMGKKDRGGEPDAQKRFFGEKGIPVLGKIEPPGTVEGGDVVLLNGETLVVGHGYRTNTEGIRQLKALTKDFIRELIVVPLPHWNGETDVMHLMSFLSPVDDDLAVVYSRLMPVPFRQWLQERRIRLIEVPDDEYDSMACNVLTLSPGKVLMLEGNPETRRRLESSGVEVIEYIGEEISRKGAGGPTCLTRPLVRA